MLNALRAIVLIPLLGTAIKGQADTTVTVFTISGNIATNASTPTAAASSPLVDLGYAVHQATTGAYYNFSNIRYAEPPVGALRFRAPVAASTADRTVQSAPPPRACFQGDALWQAQAGPLIGSVLSGANASVAGGVNSIPAPGAGAAPPAGGADIPGQTDDCLFLDVMVPQSVFDDAQAANASGTPRPGVPVRVWIHGGAESMLNNRGGMVFVQVNYRLGMFGFPPKRQDDTDTASNAGLLDQRLAMAWVQQKIHLFGGDGTQITVMGECAGASSIGHHITSFGGDPTQPLPFQKAIVQSPAWRPTSDAPFYERLFDTLLQVAGAATLDDIRNFSSTDLQTLNNKITLVSPYETFQFGTNIDNGYIPAASGVLLVQGKFHQNLSLMVGHNSNEGIFFTDPSIVDTAGYQENLPGFQPEATDDQITNLEQTSIPKTSAALKRTPRKPNA